MIAAVMCYALGDSELRAAPMNFTRSVPNVVTGLRLITVPVVVVLMLSNSLTTAFWVIVAAGISDGLDGYLAKRLDAVTRLGTVLDPLADKALLIALFICLATLDLLPGWVVCLMILRDILIVGGVLLSRVTALSILIEPTTISKLNTFLQIFLGMWMLGQAVLGADVPYIAGSLILLVALTTLASGTLYLSRWTAGYGVTATKGYAVVTGE